MQTSEKTSDRLKVTVEKWNRTGSQDEFFFQVVEACDFYTGHQYSQEELSQAGMLQFGWNTSGFESVKEHFKTGSQVNAIVDVTETNKTYTDKKTGEEKVSLSWSLVVDLTATERQKLIDTAMKMQTTAPRKASRFAKVQSAGTPAGTDQIPQAVAPEPAMADATADAGTGATAGEK